MKSYSLPQAARKFGVEPEELRAALSKGELHFRPINKTEWRLVDSEIQEWLRRSNRYPDARRYTPKIQTLDDLAREQYGVSASELFGGEKQGE